MISKGRSFYLSILAIAICSILGASNTLSAPLHSGFFVGAGVSNSWMRLLSSRYITFHNIQANPRGTARFTADSKDFLGAYFRLGYQRLINHYYLAAELTANTARPRANDVATLAWPLPVRFRAEGMLSESYSLDVLLGREFTASTTPYIRLGVAHTRIHYEFDKMGRHYRNEYPDNNSLWGTHIGFGIAHQLLQHLLLGLDYTYTFYSTSKHANKIGSVPGDSSRYVMSHKSYCLHMQHLILSVSYLF